jgi:hypothetical protein
MKYDGLITVDCRELDEAIKKAEKLEKMVENFMYLCQHSWFLRFVFGVKKGKI